MNWYIVQAYSGFEKKVAEIIKEELKKNKLSESLEEILVPTHQVTEVKKGKRTKKEKKFFPGYVLVKVDLTKQIFHLIKISKSDPKLEKIQLQEKLKQRPLLLPSLYLFSLAKIF